MSFITMFDTITLESMPADPQAVAGYTGGNWPTFATLVQKYPKAHHLSIAVSATADAECLDVENGDAVPAQAPAWVRRQQGRGVRKPVIYSSVSEMPTILAVLASAGIARDDVRLWTAHYTYREHICNPGCGFGFATTADATQWSDKALGRNLDQSLVSPSFFGETRPSVTAHYDWFPDSRFLIAGRDLQERALVEEYDRLRRHPFVHRPRLGIVRDDLSLLAGRVFTVAHEQLIDGKPSWQLWHRGWRYQQLIHRSQGRRLA